MPHSHIRSASVSYFSSSGPRVINENDDKERELGVLLKMKKFLGVGALCIFNKPSSADLGTFFIAVGIVLRFSEIHCLFLLI